MSRHVGTAQSPKMKVKDDFYILLPVFQTGNKYAHYFNFMISVKIKEGQISCTVLYTLGAAVSVGLIVLFIYLRTKQKNNLCGCCSGKKHAS